jgi:hypothetical protein
MRSVFAAGGTSVEQPPGRRLTIGDWMALIVGVALFLALPHVRTPGDALVTACLAAAFPVLYGLNIVVDALVGIPCPGCGRWTLRRLARKRSYACCSGCGRRYKRRFLGTWRDASGPDDDAVFRGRSRARAWLGFMTPPDDAESTTGMLLRNQRRRSQNRS